MFCRLLLVPALAASLAAPASAGTRDTPLCKRDLAAMSATLNTVGTQVLRAGSSKNDDACFVYRTYFIEIVKARAVTAQCKTGSERDEELGRFDSAAEQANAGIAERCG